ncbi:TetR/AcrR family transcriptional regulator [Jatrophihabitans lederbergiae]|uniref:TetR/AcrR family transcriptional regulator n=1 Tax=Jatrophihabitans lederbergiae TaxID=3075547 RepID=A0ABU2JAG5_9ACTN|nr:TetR/AcrR family transcriptional regulator [Jatrophihabitans sp. DSM 44399]MDT0261952.1 TetR/AcrR family transcriptional regulator [Jatrophihabitans sp. DSM 44399]
MASETRPSASRRERPAKPALTREGIVKTAVELMRTEGLERTTMRRLAQELDTGAASLYVYVRNTAELHAAMLDELLGTVDLSPSRGRGDWRNGLAQILTSYTEVLFEHPSLARSALVARPSGPCYLALVEALLSLLSEGAVPADRAAWGVDLLLQFATTNAAEHGTREQASTAQEEEEVLAVALRDVSSEDYPHIAAIGADLLSGPGRDRFAWGFDVLINGVLHTPRPDKGQSRRVAEQARGH